MKGWRRENYALALPRRLQFVFQFVRVVVGVGVWERWHNPTAELGKLLNRGFVMVPSG